MMDKVEQIELRHIRLRLKSNFQTSFGKEHDRECIVIRVFSGGEQGWGECVAGGEPGYSYETTGTAWHILERFFIPVLFKEDVNSAESLQETLRIYRGHPLARAGLEMALWDLQGRKLGKSFAELMEGTKARVPVGVSIGIQSDPQQMINEVNHYLEEGYLRVKIKIAPGADLEVLEAVRGAHPDLSLWVDANAAYTTDDFGILQCFDAFELGLIEQPLFEDDLLDHAALQSSISTDLCLDESIHHLRDVHHALELGSCRVINIKPARVGGFLMAREIESYCKRKGIPVWCGGMLETGIGRAANLAIASRAGFTLPGDISASDRYYVNDIAEPRFTLNEDSTINVPNQPGLGISVDKQNLETATLRKTVLRPGEM